MSAVRPPTDADVVARSIDAPDAFLLIYDRYIGDLHGYLAARVGQAKADDQAPAVLRRAFTRRHRYDETQRTVRQWLQDLARTTKNPRPGPPEPPARETVVLGRNRLRDLIDAPPRRSSWLGSAALATTGAAAIVAAIVLATAPRAEIPRDLPDLTVPANVTCVAQPCTGPLPAVVSRPLIPCGEVRLCETPTPQRVRPPRSLSGKIPS
ncbi:RNA polymerase sigma factor [Tenggerimyces flavus]|uniref:RNA polymerase sigma-70 region 2 domain-containing protein n=1 Tax=Tenggerimyces flavus TaxID=1708749 RepID=A0ABV7Y8H8_9ACTN|nr:hypothetical protein [Tenggerimyces flavus]MBM7783611.1 hypothetical protein [Tenggerimyces flavus]